MSEDITFCANYNCEDIGCERNPKNIRLPIPHTFALYTDCQKWNNNGADWFIKQMEETKCD